MIVFWSGSIQQNENELNLSFSHTHTVDAESLPYVGVVQYTGSSSSRRRDSWSRKEFGESERLATLMPPWLRDASSPDKAPVSSLWQQQRRISPAKSHVHQSQSGFGVLAVCQQRSCLIRWVFTGWRWETCTYLGVYGSAGGGGMCRSCRAEDLVGVPEGVPEPLPGLLVGWRGQRYVFLSSSSLSIVKLFFILHVSADSSLWIYFVI